MLTVRIHGWKAGNGPSVTPPELEPLLVEKAGFDGDDAESAIKRLMKGKSVDAFFYDENEDDEAWVNEFMTGIESLGLGVETFKDEPTTWTGSPPRRWFVAYALIGLVVSLVFLLVGLGLGEAFAGRLFVLIGVLLAISIPFVGGWTESARPKSPEQEARDEKLKVRFGAIVIGVGALGGLLVTMPLFGLFLLAAILGGVIIAFIIRATRRDD